MEYMILSIYLFILCLQQPRKSNFIILSVVNILFVYTQYFNWFLVGAEWLILILFYIIKFDNVFPIINIKNWLISQVTVFLAFLPVLHLFIMRISVETKRSVAITSDFGKSPLFVLLQLPSLINLNVIGSLLG